MQSDDDSMNSSVNVASFGGYFPFAFHFSLDVLNFFNEFDLDKNWKEAYAEIEVEWLSAGSQDPCNFATK